MQKNNIQVHIYNANIHYVYEGFMQESKLQLSLKTVVIRIKGGTP